MGNACSCLGGFDDQHSHHHAVRYGDVPTKYAAPCERLQQVPVSMSALQEQKHSGLSSSPRKREAPTLALEHSDLQQIDEQGTQQPAQHWHSPTAAERQQHHQQYLQGQACAAGAVDAASQQEPEELELPEVPFSWTKGDLIGIGAFGRVYTALNNETGELVAVKQVSFAQDEALQGRVAEHIRALEAEVEVLKTLQHENIVRYLGTERTDDALHIFLEYVPEGSIASRLTRFGPFPEAVIRVYTAQLLRGLEYLHARGIMHRDIKGANILIDKHGTVKLADFGASKKIEDLATVGSGAKSIRGTPYWMAPEVIKQTGHGRPADIWSLACTVIEMATGKPPWSTYTAPVAAMFQIASSKDPPPLPDHLSPEAKDFLLLCFNRVARDRANATRLLKHPFVTKAQLPSPAPFPGSSPSTTTSNGSPASSQRTPAGPSRGTLLSSVAAAGGSTPQQGRAADGRQPHTPPGARHSTAMQPAFANGSTSLRPGGVSAAAMAGSNKARCSPPANAHASPRRVQQQLLQQQQLEGPGAAGGASHAANQRGDASAIVSALRQQQQQQAAAKQQQEDGPLKQQQQQQQGRSSPRPPEQQLQQHQQQPGQQPGQQQGRRSITPRSAAAAGAAAAAAAAGGGGLGQDTTCMTLVDWNPMVEPSWMPGAYQVPGQGSSSNNTAGRQASTGAEQLQQQQQQPYGAGRGSSNGSRHGQQHCGTAADAAADANTPSRAQAGHFIPPGAFANGPAAAAAAHMKRGGSSSSSVAGGGSLLAAPTGSIRSNAGIGSRKLEGGSGPLASGPVGRASRENGLGLGGNAAAGAGAAAALPPAAAGTAAAGSAAGRLGSNGSSSRAAWGTGLSPAAAAATAGLGGQGLVGPGAFAGAGTGISPARSSYSAASGSDCCDGDGCGEEGAAVGRTASSSTATGSGPLLQQVESQRLSSSGSYGRASSQQGGGTAAAAAGAEQQPPQGSSALSALQSKHAQWEQELLEELARKRAEERASRAAGQAGSRRSVLQQQLN